MPDDRKNGPIKVCYKAESKVNGFLIRFSLAKQDDRLIVYVLWEKGDLNHVNKRVFDSMVEDRLDHAVSWIEKVCKQVGLKGKLDWEEIDEES